MKGTDMASQSPQPSSGTERRLPTLDEQARSLLFIEARTANTYSPEAVDDQTLREIWDLAQWPPTLANSNPLRMVFVRTPAAKQRLIPLMHEGNRAKVAAAPVTAILAADTLYWESLTMLLPYKPEMRNIIAGRGDRDAVGSFNAALQAGYFLLAVRSVGLAAGPMEGFDHVGVDAEFLAATNWRSVLTVNIGHPGEGAWFGRLPRHAPDDVLRFT